MQPHPLPTMATRKKNTAAAAETAASGTPLDSGAPPDVTPPADFSGAPPAVLRVLAAEGTGDARRSARGLASVLVDLDAPPPAFLAGVGVDAPAVGCELSGFDALARLHAHPVSEAPAEAADSCARLLPALRALLSSEAAADFLLAVDEEPVPTWSWGRPRLGFRPAGRPAHLRPAGEGEAAYQCAATGRRFALPAGAPVPCLLFDYLDADGLDPRRSDGHPEDRNPTSLDLHPSLAARGPAAVLAALWGDLRSRLNDVALKLEEAAGLATLLAGMEPADVPDNEVPRALVRYEPAEGERAEGAAYVAVPAGWRDLGRP